MAGEIHVPGLDLNQKLWTYHTIFMSEMHANLTGVSIRGYEGYSTQGRGALFADADQWLRVVKRQFDAVKGDVPLSYLPAEEVLARVDFGILQVGFKEMLNSYDPDRQFVLTVQHHPGDLLSGYLVTPLPYPAELYRARNSSVVEDSSAREHYPPPETAQK